jgi:serine/threonine-protein kinase
VTAPIRCPKCNALFESDNPFCGRCGAPRPVDAAGPEAPVPTQQNAALEAALREALAPRYLLLRLLGSGGMGSVYLAREPALKRLVAVKVLAPMLAADDTSRARFQREAQAVAGISHPNVVSIYAVGELADGTPYFVMQHVGGESLSARLVREGPVPAAEGRRLLGQVASALAAAHAKGIIHRDIKPANVLYDEESGRVLVTDFGIAAVLPTSDADAPTSLTVTGIAIGTPQYMSPEQLLAEQVTDRTDIYSLGLLAYEILTGAGPFKINSPREAIAAHLRDTPRRLSELKPDIDHELESLVSACLRKDPEQRPAAAELAQRLGASETVLEWPPPGLDALLGSADRLSRRFALASVLFVGPLLAMIGLGPPLAKTAMAMFLFLLVTASAGGAVLLIIDAGRALRLGRAVANAVRGGYGWLTVAEVLADRRGDTGALIAGTREYAALTPDARDRFRLGRAGGALARALAATLASPLIVAAFIFGPRGSAATFMIPAVVVLFALGLTLAGAWLSLPEWRALRVLRGQRRRRATAAGAERLGEAWYQSFETARRGQRQGRGSQARPAISRVLAFLLALVVTGGALVILPVLVVPIVSRTYWQPQKYSDTHNKLRIAAIARGFRLPTDSTITPIVAGRALTALGGVLDTGTHGAIERAQRAMFPLLPGSYSEGPEWFPSGGGAFGGFAQFRGDSLIMRAATRGFTPAEQAYLSRVASNPAFATVHTLARAAQLDYLGATYALPFTDSATARDVPIPRYGKVKEVAYAAVARAAWLVSQGRRAEAETAIREAISIGFLLVDQGHTLLDVLVGVVMTGIGRNALMTFYDATGRPAEARALRAARDSVLNRMDAVSSARGESVDVLDIPAVRRQLINEVRDPSSGRGLRWSALQSLMYAQCTDLREVLFGPDRDLRVTVDEARRALVHYPVEAAVFNLVAASAEQYPARLQPNPRAAFVSHLVAWDAAILRNDRISGCLGPAIAEMFARRAQ